MSDKMYRIWAHVHKQSGRWVYSIYIKTPNALKCTGELGSYITWSHAFENAMCEVNNWRLGPEGGIQWHRKYAWLNKTRIEKM